MTNTNRWKVLNALELKVLAMVLMLCDHMWGTIVPGNQWLTSIGRLAFPIFAFQLAEGFARTHDRKGYLARLFFWALVTEIPFNFMMGGSWVQPFHQNVLFTFCEAFLMLWLLDWAKKKSIWCFALMIPAAGTLGYALGMLTFVDYYGYGILMVILFYLTRELKFGWLIQLVGMYVINCQMLAGLELDFGFMTFPQQGLAMLALIPIWLYNGKQGPHCPAIRRACYAFYPVHILVLVLIRDLILGA